VGVKKEYDDMASACDGGTDDHSSPQIGGKLASAKIFRSNYMSKFGNRSGSKIVPKQEQRVTSEL